MLIIFNNDYTRRKTYFIDSQLKVIELNDTHFGLNKVRYLNGCAISCVRYR